MIGANFDNAADRSREELAARRNRERLEVLTYASEVGVWFCDLPFDTLVWDVRVKEHFWLPPEAVVTMDTFYERIHPEDRERTRLAIEESIARQSRYDIDYRTVSPGGQQKWIHAIGHAHYDANGNPIRFDGVTIDISEHKFAETRNRFLQKLDDALRPLSDPQEITLTAARVLGAHIHADRCAYADIEADQDTMNLTGNYMRSPEIKSIIGRMTFTDFGEEVLRLMREDRPYVVNDVDQHDPPIANAAAYRATQIQAVICVPLHKSGRFVAAMAVHMAAPRTWTLDEVELVSAVAARCWESIERVRLERGLRESEERFRAFVTTSSDAVFRMSADWQEMRKLTGSGYVVETDRPTVSWLSTYIPAEDQQRVQSAIDHAIRNCSTFDLEHRVIRSDGTYGWTHSRAIPLLDQEGRITEWFGAASDITHRRGAEQALRESEERYRSLFDSIDEGFAVIEVLFDEHQQPNDYRFLEVNPAFAKHTGMQAVGGKLMSDFFSPVEPRWLENYGGVAVTGQAIRFAEEYKGLNRWFDVYAFRVGAPHERKVALIFNDITERKQTEIALRESEERARAASVAKDNFLAQLSHELRTPLTPVLMTAAALRDDPSMSPAAREAFAMIERNVALEARLIDDLLDLTRVTRGKLALRTETCDLHLLLRQAAEIVRDEMREKQIALTLDLTARYTHGRGDPARLQQVFWNLLRNAVNFTPRGGRITILSRDEPATAKDGSGATICIEVTDSGIGFDSCHAENLFEPFYQGKGSESAGLGLGLAIARALVELHHGAIKAESPGVGRGATFTVHLPVSPSAPMATADSSSPPAASDRQPTPSMRLLLVEDHEATMRVLTNLLTRDGHIVTGASTITAALDAARSHTFDAVVSDLGLPDGTGIQLMKTLRDEHQLTGIALSGYGMESDLRRSKEAGFAAHLVKPVNFEELRTALRALRSEA
jgi:PAS domain S-box-containing protein